jgi:hypothetical protein
VIDPLRRLAAAAVALTLFALVACDLWIGRFREWWDGHSLTGDIVSSMLVVAVTGLIVDEVVARRQRRDRAVSVAVQAVIVYGQTRRAYDAVLASDADETSSSDSSDDLRALASMLLAASPSLFDDPPARVFLAQAERLAATIYRSAAASSGGGLSADDRARLVSEMSQLQATVEPLVARIPTEDRSVLEGSDQARP